MSIHKPYEEKPNNEPTPRILPKELRAKVPGENKEPNADPAKSKGKLNEGRPHPNKQGGAGEPQTTPLEPEKQGGIGGP